MPGQDAYHWTPDLLQLIEETVPRLVKAKAAVVTFFRSAGTPERLLAPVQAVVADINKFEITRRLIGPLNAEGDAMLAVRREVIRRIAEWQDFSTCWDNERLKAMGLVAAVRDLVGGKDAATRVQDFAARAQAEKLAERRQRQTADAAERVAHQAVKDRFAALYGMKDPYARAKALETVLAELFGFHKVLVEEPFTLRGLEGEGVVEQVDGVIRLDNQLCVVEAKWHTEPIGTDEASGHLYRVFSRPGGTGGLLITASEVTKPVLAQHRDAIVKGSVVTICLVDELWGLIARGHELQPFLRAKMDAAVTRREPFHRPLD